MLFGGGLWVNWILCQHQSDWEVKQEVSHTLLLASGSSTDAPPAPPAPTLFTCYSACVALLSFQLFVFYFIFYESNRYKRKPPVLQYRREMQKVPEASCLTPSAAVSCDTANFILHHVAGLLDGAFSSFSKYNVFLQSRLPCVCFPRRKPLGYLHSLDKGKKIWNQNLFGPFNPHFSQKKNYKLHSNKRLERQKAFKFVTAGWDTEPPVEMHRHSDETIEQQVTHTTFMFKYCI